MLSAARTALEVVIDGKNGPLETLNIWHRAEALAHDREVQLVAYSDLWLLELARGLLTRFTSDTCDRVRSRSIHGSCSSR